MYPNDGGVVDNTYTYVCVVDNKYWGLIIHILYIRTYLVNGAYGTAQFKLEARVRVTRVCFVAPLEYFSKSCVSVDNCTGILRAIHARVTSPYMHACG